MYSQFMMHGQKNIVILLFDRDPEEKHET